MSDLRIDQELRRVSAALAEASPEAPSLTTAPTRRSVWMRPAVVGFAAALVAGVVGVALFTSSDSPSPVAGEEQTRWEWIVANSTVVSEELLWADTSATPEPEFDYLALGTEKALVAMHQSAIPAPGLVVPDPLAPAVHVGRFGSVEEGGPVDVFLVRSTLISGEVVICTHLVGLGGGGAGCDHDGEPVDGMVGVGEYGDGLAMARVGFVVPRGTAVFVVHLEDGQTFVQRPIVGTGAMLLDLDESWIDYVEALDAQGNVLMRDEVGDPPPGIGTTTTTFGTTTSEVAVTDPELHVSGATTRYTLTGDVLVEGFVDQPAQVTVGGMEATEHVDPDGRTSFWAELTLDPGEHEIQVIAITDAGGAAGATLRFVVDPDLEQWFGYFAGLDEESLTMAVDTAEWLTGEEAVSAARADGVIPADQDFIENDYYIRNLVADALIAPLGDDPVIVLQACWEDGPCVSEEQVDLATWLALLADPESGTEAAGWWWYGTNTLPYWFTFQDGVVVQITEHYLP